MAEKLLPQLSNAPACLIRVCGIEREPAWLPTTELRASPWAICCQVERLS